MRCRDDKKESTLRLKAMEMIVADGFDGLSMQRLAKAACVSPATIYIYWKNRENLLNQLYHDVQHTFTEVALEGFHPELSLQEGLWLQWKNRLRFIEEYPIHFKFYEMFRHSPLINRSDMKFSIFKENMRVFMENSKRRGEMQEMPAEVFWSLAFAPFYSLVQFHLHQRQVLNKDFKLTDAVLLQAFEMVVSAFKPQTASTNSDR
jgi:TetR/AcrR family transcriptional regulator, multidrug resistance operon repressor